jgi:hypothetical protein
MTQVSTYEIESGRRIWSGALDILLLAQHDGLTEEDVGRLEGLEPGESTEVGMGFRVERTDGVSHLRLIQGGLR